MDANNWRPVSSSEDDWRTQLPPNSRQLIACDLTERLYRNFPFCSQEGLEQLKKTAEYYAEHIYATSIHRPHYLKQIYFTMRAVDAMSQITCPDPSGNHNKLPDSGARERILSQNIPPSNTLGSTGIQSCSSLTVQPPPIRDLRRRSSIIDFLEHNLTMQNVCGVPEVVQQQLKHGFRYVHKQHLIQMFHEQQSLQRMKNLSGLQQNFTQQSAESTVQNAQSFHSELKQLQQEANFHRRKLGPMMQHTQKHPNGRDIQQNQLYERQKRVFEDMKEQPLQRLIKAVKCMSFEALSASVNDMASVLNTIDRINEPPLDLEAIENHRLQVRDVITQVDGMLPGARKMKYAMHLNAVSSSAGSGSDTFMFGGDVPSDLESTATSRAKRPRIEANHHALLQEIRGINVGLIDTVVGSPEEAAGGPNAAAKEVMEALWMTLSLAQL